jgi:hypothetical protein
MHVHGTVRGRVNVWMIEFVGVRIGEVSGRGVGETTNFNITNTTEQKTNFREFRTLCRGATRVSNQTLYALATIQCDSCN